MGKLPKFARGSSPQNAIGAPWDPKVKLGSLSIMRMWLLKIFLYFNMGLGWWEFGILQVHGVGAGNFLLLGRHVATGMIVCATTNKGHMNFAFGE